MTRCTHHGDSGTYIVRCACGNVWKYGVYVGRVANSDPWQRPEDILLDAAHEYSNRALAVTK